MLEHPRESWIKSRSRFLIKFFFFSEIEPSERVKLIEHRLIVCKLRQEYLESQQAKNIPVDPYQNSAWNRAKLMLNSEMQWLREELVRELELVNYQYKTADKLNFNSILSAEIISIKNNK